MKIGDVYYEKHTVTKISNRTNTVSETQAERVNVIPQDWIHISERMPEDGQNVLFCDIDNDIMVGHHVQGRPSSHFTQNGTWEDMKNVIAWMPLPEPYKVEIEE